MIIVEDALAGDLYKFISWVNSQLAINEVDIYAYFYAKNIDCSNIVQLKAIGATQHCLVRQMERSSLGVLDRFLLGKDNLSEQQISKLLIPLVQALKQLHALNILHRDLKAENILVFASPYHLDAIQLKLSDFDRAIILPANDFLDKPVGSLLHMAPELLAGQVYNHKVDIYAFAMLLFEFAHGGSQPYSNIGTGMPDSITRSEFADKVVNNNLRPTWRYTSTKLKALSEDCWQVNPKQRPEFSEVLERLNQMAMASITMPVTSNLVAPTAIRKNTGLACHIGKARSTMEDAAVLLDAPNYLIAAIFDGLRDNLCSNFTAHQLPLLLTHALQKDAINIEMALLNSFAQVQSTLELMQPAIKSGSTVTLALLYESELWLAWLGDSPAWLLRTNQANEKPDEVIELTVAHTPERSDEAQRIAMCGGRVGRELIWMDNGEQMPSGLVRVYYPADNKKTGVALSRALGLVDFKPVVSSEVQIIRHPYQSCDRFLLMASDGVLSFLNKDKVLEIAAKSESSQKIADLLIEEVLMRGAPDNASIIVLNLQNFKFCGN